MAHDITVTPEAIAPPTQGCPWCWGRRFWQHARTGRWVCGRCHAPPAAGRWAELSRQVLRTALAVRGSALGARGTRRAPAEATELQLVPTAHVLADVAHDRGLVRDGLD